MSDTQADLRLVNLTSQGFTLAEARRKLGIEPAPATTSEAETPELKTTKVKAPAAAEADNALL